MVDQNNGDSDKKLRADPMNLTDIENIEMLIYENAVEIASIVKPIMQRYIGENPMSESEMELATFLNDCVLIKEVESGSTDPIEAMHIEDNLPLHRERTTPGSDRNDQ
jgi:hypothetical protein